MAYYEPCCGGASVLLTKDRSVNEAISDVDKGVVAILKALRDEPDEFIRRIRQLSYDLKTFNDTLTQPACDDYIDLAINEYVLRRMSRGGMKKVFAWSDRQRGGKPGDVNAWDTIIEDLPSISDRLQNVTILQTPFQKVIKMWDDERILIYFDPPYMPDTRSEGAKNCYEHEMTADDHIELLEYATDTKAKVIISGYHSSLYSKRLQGWRTVTKDMPNHASQSKTKARRCEVLWMNYCGKCGLILPRTGTQPVPGTTCECGKRN